MRRSAARAPGYVREHAGQDLFELCSLAIPWRRSEWERVAAAVRHCAPRIYVRLALWRIAPDVREKTPMPPPSPSIRADMHAPPAAVAGLERAAAALVRAETGAEPQLDRLLADGYEQLRPCLPG